MHSGTICPIDVMDNFLVSRKTVSDIKELILNFVFVFNRTGYYW